ncbi:MAG: YccS/YhfK family membrane protein [Methanomassiliicoccaceae archaeon]|nr:YccS/YhfK family membrane protein [Methanomassiliicoccaceae archaeon]
MTEKTEKKSIGSSLVGGIVMTILLVVIVPIVVSWLIQPIVEDFIGDTSLMGLTSGAIGAIVMFVILILFMLLLGGGAILRKYGIIGVAGLILAYVLLGYFVDESFYLGWIIPVIIVAILGAFSYLKDKKKGK